LVTTRLRSARDGMLNRPRRACMFRSMRPLVSTAFRSARANASATRGFERSSSANRPSFSSPTSYRCLRMCVPSQPRRGAEYRDPPLGASMGRAPCRRRA
jgi:hypothetical protein